MHLDKCQSGGSSICRNGGTCVIKEDGKIECLCLNTFSGSFCEQGSIVAWWNLKQILLAINCLYLNMTSILCIFWDRCSPNGNKICKNGGTCTLSDGDGVSCTCPSTHYGIYCENGKMNKKAYWIP